MRSSVLIASAGLAIAAGPALADFTDHNAGTPTLVSSFKIGTPGSHRFDEPTSDPNPGTPIYDMDDIAVSGSFLNGGAAVQSGNTITRMVMDDCTTAAYTYGSFITRLYFSVVNANTVSVAARPRVRFWYDSAQAPGQPGGYYPVGAGTGYTFSAITFAASSTNLFYFDPSLVSAIPPYPMPLDGTSMTLWMGMVFDNGTGATGATAAQMNLLGQATANPSPTVGSSTTRIFRTTAAGSFFLVNNPAGTVFNLSAGTNLAWEIVATVPTPSAAALLGLGGLIAARRRRVS